MGRPLAGKSFDQALQEEGFKTCIEAISFSIKTYTNGLTLSNGAEEVQLNGSNWTGPYCDDQSNQYILDHGTVPPTQVICTSMLSQQHVNHAAGAEDVDDDDYSDSEDRILVWRSQYY